MKALHNKTTGTSYTIRRRRKSRRSWELTPAEARVKAARPCPDCGTVTPKGGEETFKEQVILCRLHRSASNLLAVLKHLAVNGPLPEFAYDAIAEAENRERPRFGH
jgi:hypothetical protein